eukprot:gene18451-18727_t
MQKHIAYGEMIAFVYDTVESNKDSLNYQEDFPLKGYDYVATLRGYPAGSKNSFFGFAAFNVQEMELVFVIRGSMFSNDWAANLDAAASLWNQNHTDDRGPQNIKKFDYSSIAVHAGFYDTYTQTSTELNAAHASLQITCTKTLREIQKKYPDQNISVVFTGHSLGAAFSVLAAVDMAEVVEVPKSLKLILQNIAKSVDKVDVVIPRRQSFLNKKGAQRVVQPHGALSQVFQNSCYCTTATVAKLWEMLPKFGLLPDSVDRTCPTYNFGTRLSCDYAVATSCIPSSMQNALRQVKTVIAELVDSEGIIGCSELGSVYSYVD